MFNSAYNPFNGKNIDSINRKDLDLLIENEVTEGFFVEYKSQFQSSQKIAKSIASLANTYGGWYIVGVKEIKRIASEICGYSSSAMADASTLVRQAVSLNVHPVPLYFIKEIGIEPDRCVLIVYVPREQNTPFVCSNGVIYRRNQDSSEPIPEKDRYALDRLVEIGHDRDHEFSRFCLDNRGECSAESEFPRIAVYILPSPSGSVENALIRKGEKTAINRVLELANSTLSFGKYRNLPQPIGEVSTKYSELQIGLGSIHLRQYSPDYEQRMYNPTECIVSSNGGLKYFSYLPQLGPLSEYCWSEFETDGMSDTILKLTEKIGTLPLTVLDIKTIWNLIHWVTSFHRELFREEWYHGVYVKLIIENVWRTVPMIDSIGFKNHIEQYGIPVIYERRIEIPNNLSKRTIWLRTEQESSLGVGLSEGVSRALGIPQDVYIDCMVPSQNTESQYKTDGR